MCSQAGPPDSPGAGSRRVRCRAGHAVRALKQVAPLIAPVAEAIAAHGRQAGHVHADKTSWQVFEDIEDKDGHRSSLSVFVTDATTVFMMDTSRRANVAAGHWASTGYNQAKGPPRLVILLGLPQGLPVAGPHQRHGPVVVLAVSGGISCGPGRSPEALGTGRRVDRADRVLDRRTRAARPPHRAPTPASAAQAASSGLHRHRRAPHPAGGADAAKGLLHPAAAKVIATLSNEWAMGWPGTRSCRSCRWITTPRKERCGPR